jgi:hypothetical protein
MTQDLLAGRPLEVDEVFGDIVDRAQAAGIPVPRITLVRDLLRGLRRHLAVGDRGEVELGPGGNVLEAGDALLVDGDPGGEVLDEEVERAGQLGGWLGGLSGPGGAGRAQQGGGHDGRAAGHERSPGGLLGLRDNADHWVSFFRGARRRSEPHSLDW